MGQEGSSPTCSANKIKLGYNLCMNKWLRGIFSLILIFSLYHFVRDILQMLDLHTPFTSVLHRSHVWCQPACDYVTLPLDILGLFGPLVILIRNRVGILGILTLLTLPLWLLALLLP